MNQDQMEGKWKQLKSSFKEKWGKFTDDDITRLNGNREKIVGALQEKYGQTKEQAQRESTLGIRARNTKTRGPAAAAPSGV
jgi:uncharacterized protein YjbJ (UPF0337 family)